MNTMDKIALILFERRRDLIAFFGRARFNERIAAYRPLVLEFAEDQKCTPLGAAITIVDEMGDELDAVSQNLLFLSALESGSEVTNG